jgi:hypothetical protein
MKTVMEEEEGTPYRSILDWTAGNQISSMLGYSSYMIDSALQHTQHTNSLIWLLKQIQIILIQL